MSAYEIMLDQMSALDGVISLLLTERMFIGQGANLWRTEF